MWLRNGALSLFFLLVVPHELKAARGERFMPSPVLTAVWCTVLVLFAVAVLSDIGRWVEVALLIVIWILVPWRSSRRNEGQQQCGELGWGMMST